MKKSDASEKAITYPLLHRVWHDVLPDKILETCKNSRPDRRWSMVGKLIRCICPYHKGATEETFFLDFERGFGLCYSCGHYNSQFFDLYADLTGKTIIESYPQLLKEFNLKFLPKTPGQLFTWQTQQALKQRIVSVCHDFLLAAVAAPDDDNFIWAQPAVEWLSQTRKISTDVFHYLNMIGVFPPVQMLINEIAVRDSQDLEKWKLAYQNSEKVERPKRLADEAASLFRDQAIIPYNNWTGSVVFRHDLTIDIIGAIKLRKPESRDTALLPQTGQELGFFGLGWGQYQPLRVGVDPRNNPVRIVKSEFDVLSLISQMLLDEGVVSFPLIGASAQGDQAPMDNLPHSGFSEALLIPDPGEVGDVQVKAWLGHSHTVRTRVFDNHEALGNLRDLDVAALTHGLVKCKSALLVDEDYRLPQEWVFERTEPAVSPIDAKDVRARVTACADLGRVLRDPTECDAYIELCARQWKLPLTAIRREIVAKDEDEPGFILRAASALTKEFYIVGQSTFDSSRRLYLWHRTSGHLTWVNLSDDNHAERQLAPLLGPAYQWFTDQVGIPAFLEVPDDERESGTYLQERDKSLRWYTRQALLHISMSAPNYDSAPHYAQGLHAIVKRGNEAVYYLVNGPQVYHGVPAVDETVHWTALEGPSHDGSIFETGLRKQKLPWLRTVGNAADLEVGSKIDLRSVYDRLVKILDVGWRFENHDMTVKFLAGHLIATTIGNAFGRSVSVGFHANSSSGKSKLCMGLISGKDFPRIQILSVAMGTGNFTAAGVRQEMNHCTRALVLDEFEDEGSHDRKSKEVEDVYAMLRSAVGANNTFSMGSRDGHAIEYSLNFYLYVGAINKPRKVQDANRMIAINMAHVKGRADPVQLILAEVGDEGIQKLRDDLETAAIARLPKMRRIYAELEIEFNAPGAKPAGVDQRFFEALLPSLTIMKYLGMDYKKFGFDFAEIAQNANTSTGNKSESQQLMDWVFQSPSIWAAIDPNKPPVRTSLNYLLSSPETRELINGSNSGIYFDMDSHTVVVNWLQAMQSVLSSHPRYRTESNVANIRDLANRAESVLTYQTLTRSGVLDRLRRQGLFNVSAMSLTAYNVTGILGQLDANQTVTTVQPEEKPDEVLPRMPETGTDEPDFS